jgi:hypothetical protein
MDWWARILVELEFEFEFLGEICRDLGAARVVDRRKVPRRASESFIIMFYNFPAIRFEEGMT